jgi:outer membrane protein assembly factor BamB
MHLSGALSLALACVSAGGLVADAAPLPDPTAGSVIAIASPEPGWPQWRGPRRDGVCDERGLRSTWPEAGPTQLWTTTNLGQGYSAPIIARNRVFITGDTGDHLRIMALDLEGQVLWQATNGRAWLTPYPGARACVAYRNGRLFHLNAHGRVTALDPDTGHESWSVELFERFGGKTLTWGLSECLLVDNDHVIVTPGGTRALMAALDTRSGETRWATEPLRLGPSADPRQHRVAEPTGETDRAAYASPILLRVGDQRWIVSCSLRHLFGVDADTGQLLWTRPLPTRFEVIAAAPVLHGQSVFFTAPDAGGGRSYSLRPSNNSLALEPTWTSPLDTCHGGVVYHDGALFGSWYRARNGWACLDATTGALRYETNDLASGSVLYADGRLYCLSQEGEMALLEPTAHRFEFRGRFRLVNKRVTDAWAHPVIHAGRLYLRYHDRLTCYDVREPAGSTPTAGPLRSSGTP